MTGGLRFWRLAAAVASGLLYFLGFVGVGWWPLIFVFWVPLLAAIHDVRSPWKVLGLGALAGTVAMMGGYYWVVHLLQVFAGLPAGWAFVGYLLLAMYQGGIMAVSAWVVHRSRGAPAALSLTVALVLWESAYPLLFPNYAGNTLYRVPVLTQHVELVGMAGLSALVGLVNGALWDAIRAASGVFEGRPRRVARAAAPAVLALGIAAAYGAIRIPMVDRVIERADSLKVALIQANLGSNDMNRRRDEFISTHQRMTRRAIEKNPDLDLTVWPESGYNRSLPRARDNLGFVSGNRQVPLLFGAITYEYVPIPGEAGRERKAYNSAVLTSSTGTVLSRYDKTRLLMFGETLPFVETFPKVKKLFPRSGTLTRGRDLRHLQLGDVELLPMICYEDLMPSLVRQLWNVSGPAELLVNITNDSWYGDTHEPITHLALATFRSIETRRAMIRSTNTGISAIVDPVGRIAARTEQWERQTLVADVPVIRDDDATLFLRIGNVLGWWALAVALWWAWPRKR
jgi:apolipoprotein N-acyltransferase